MKSLKELWRPVKGYEGLYEVSSLGRVMSLHYKGGKTCQILSDKNKSSSGYPRVSLFKDEKMKIRPVHRLVAEAFIPNPENKPCVDHINTIRDDNRVENLRWVTVYENSHNPITEINHSVGIQRGWGSVRTPKT